MKLRITVEGVAYEVEVEVLDEGAANGGLPAAPPPVRRPAPEAPPAAPEPRPGLSPAAGSHNVCKSPLAGVVLAMHVKVGDEVGQNQVLAVLEAMKMETKIAAPMPGTVKAVHASVGDTVKSGQVLVEFE